MKVYKVLYASGSQLHSFNVTCKNAAGLAGLGDGVVSLLYRPGVATKPVIPNSGLYAFTDRDAAVAFSDRYPCMQVWECEAEFLGYISHPRAGAQWICSHADHIKFWAETPLELYPVECSGSESAGLCSSITPKHRVA